MTSLEKAALNTLEFLRTRRLGAEAHIAALEAALAESQPQPQPQPLTDEQIDALPWNGSPRRFARAVEKALGIGGDK